MLSQWVSSHGVVVSGALAPGLANAAVSHRLVAFRALGQGQTVYSFLVLPHVSFVSPPFICLPALLPSTHGCRNPDNPFIRRPWSGQKSPLFSPFLAGSGRGIGVQSQPLTQWLAYEVLRLLELPTVSSQGDGAPRALCSAITALLESGTLARTGRTQDAI